MRKLCEFTDSVQCQLTEEERHERRALVCSALAKIDRLERARATQIAESKAAVDILKEELHQARLAADSGVELRDVLVERWIDSRGEVTEHRADTGEVIKHRAATAAERQDALDLAQPTPKPGQAPPPERHPDQTPTPPTEPGSDPARAPQPEKPTQPGVPTQNPQRTRKAIAAPDEWAAP